MGNARAVLLGLAGQGWEDGQLWEPGPPQPDTTASSWPSTHAVTLRPRLSIRLPLTSCVA